MQKPKVIIWGTGEDYAKIYNQIKLEELRNNLEVVALCCRKQDLKSDTVDGYKVCCKDDLKSIDFDYIIIANKGSFNTIKRDAQALLVAFNKRAVILNFEIFLIPRFNFKLAISDNKKLQEALLSQKYDFDYEQFSLSRDSLLNNEWYKNNSKGIEKFHQLIDIQKKISNLTRGLSSESIFTVKNIIRKIQLCSDLKMDIEGCNSRSYFIPFNTKELDDLENIQRNIKENKSYIGNGIFRYKRYKQISTDYFEINNYYFSQGVDKIFNKGYVKGKSIVDAGAYIGDSAMVLADKFPCKNVLAFEPSDSTYHELCKTINLNGYNNIVPIKKGLGSKKETLSFYHYTDIDSMNDTFNKPSNSHNYVESKIEVTTLDEYVKENNIKVGLIKTDLEGYEKEFLKGAIQTIKEQRPILVISIYHSLDDFFDIKPWIEELDCGYNFQIFKPLDGSIMCETRLIAEPIE